MRMRSFGCYVVVATLYCCGAFHSARANQHVFFPGMYVAAHAGASALSETDTGIDHDNGLGVSAVLGYRSGKIWRRGGIRAEIEALYSSNDLDHMSGGKTDMTAGSINVYHDFEFFFLDKNLKWVTPYLGGGVGTSTIETKSVGFEKSESSAIYQGIAGFSWTTGYNTDITVDYRYMTAPEAESVNFERHSVNAGLRYRFMNPKR